MSTQDETQNARNRRAFCQEVALDPGSLVGSWFLKTDGGFGIEEEGIVVGEPQPGMYLLDSEKGRASRRVQIVVKLETMIEEQWMFFDSEESLRLERALLLADEESIR